VARRLRQCGTFERTATFMPMKPAGRGQHRADEEADRRSPAELVVEAERRKGTIETSAIVMYWRLEDRRRRPPG
jgi:hypothetical protein